MFNFLKMTRHFRAGARPKMHLINTKCATGAVMNGIVTATAITAAATATVIVIATVIAVVEKTGAGIVAATATGKRRAVTRATTATATGTATGTGAVIATVTGVATVEVANETGTAAIGIDPASPASDNGMVGATEDHTMSPSKTPKQARTMAAAAHNPKFAKKMGIPQGVAKDFNKADKGTGKIKGKRGK